MESLPDDVLLAVLSLLPVGQLLRVRGVCRRWRDLALHPHLWRDRCAGLATSASVTRALLRVVPVLEELDLTDFGFGYPDMYYEAAITECAAVHLVLRGTPSNITMASIAIRNQARLGRLRQLKVVLDRDVVRCDPRGAASLLRAVHATRSLRVLDVDILGVMSAADWSVVGNSFAPLLPASLTRLCFSCPYPNPHLEFQLRSHAATLEEVSLCLMQSIYALPAALLNAMPNLRALETPLLADMHLLDFGRLDSLYLNVTSWVEEEVNPEAYEARLAAVQLRLRHALLRNGTDLSGLRELRVDVSPGSGLEIAFDLVQAAASSGQSRLEKLMLTDGDIETSATALRVAAVMPQLPRLVTFTLERGRVCDRFLEKISPSSAPRLSLLSMDSWGDGWVEPGCAHAWLHRPAVQRCLRRNPGLHVEVCVRLCNRNEAEDCAFCGGAARQQQQQCHPGLTYGMWVVVFTHPLHAIGEGCVCRLMDHGDGIPTRQRVHFQLSDE